MPSWLPLLAVLGPVVVALALTPWRDRLAGADDALILVVVIVAVATAGYRWAAPPSHRGHAPRRRLHSRLHGAGAPQLLMYGPTKLHKCS